VIDVLKPHEPEMVEIATAVSESDGVAGVNASLIETDREVQNVKLTVEGEDVDPDDVEAIVDRVGGTVHSYDEVVCGERMIETSTTPQD
jgi:hypothetical protein